MKLSDFFRRGAIAAACILAVLLVSSITAQPGTFAQFQASAPSVTCAQATTYLARTSGGNEGGNAAPITTLICGLVTDGVITGNLGATGCGTTLDALYVFAQQNSTDALLNVCGSNYTATLTLSPTFTTFRGFSFSSGAFINTHFNAATATTPNFVRNSANYGIWSNAVVAEAVAQMGTTGNGSPGESNLYDDFTGGVTFYGRINSVGGTSGPVTQPGTKGLFITERTSSTATTLYWDGVSQGGVTDTSAAPNSVGFTIGAVNGISGFTAQTISESHLGASLGATLNLALYTRLRTYMTAVGVP